MHNGLSITKASTVRTCFLHWNA